MNPLLLDPTHTSLLRKQAINDLTRRYALLQRAVYELLVVEDAFGFNETVVNAGANCGTGAGGFKPGNKCAKGGSGGVADLDVSAKLKKGSETKFLSSLTDHETRAWTEYKGDNPYAPGAAIALNGMLRDQSPLSPAQTEALSHLDSSFRKAPRLKEETTLYRGTSERMVESKGGWVDSKAFVSTSVRREEAENFAGLTGNEAYLYEIKVPKGFTVMPTSHFHADTSIAEEGELVLPRNAAMRVTGQRGNTIQVEVMGGQAWMLKEPKPTTNILTGNARWSFLTTPQKLEQFKEWLNTQVRANILSGNDLDGDEWIAKYTKTSYKRGANKAYDEVKAPLLKDKLDRYQGGKAQFLERLESETHKQQIKLLASRTYDELADSVGTMSNQISRTLIDGVIQKLPMEKIAKNLDERIGVGLSSAQRIARTEIARSFNEGKLNALEELGVGDVEIMVEWQTARRPCPVCAPLNHVVMTVKQAHGLFPRHPNCYCTFKAVRTKPNQGQVRTRSRIAAAIGRSLKQERPKRSKRSIATQKKMSTWGGANKRIGKIKRKKKRLTKA